jgi:phosphatidylserine/phosphatidylglycerophosphate/cardiolipin synthase-like enzyme
VPKSSMVAGAVLALCLLAARAGTNGDGGGSVAPGVDARPAAFALGGTGSGGGKGPETPAVQTGPIFNVPDGRVAKQDAIATQVGRLIDGARRGAVITIAMYHFSSMDTAAQLVAASRRKVSVRVVLDHESTASAAYRRLRKGLGKNTKESSWVVVCGANRGCIGPEFNHNKFFLFSTTLGAPNVVVQTSANSTDGARDTQWNDALTIEDAGVYAGYLGYFNDLATQRHTANYHRTVQTGPYRLDFFPWSSGDPISDALDKVSCAGGTRLRLSLGHFTWGPIAKRLWKLDDAGCRVQLVFDRVGRTAIRDLTKHGGRNGNPEIRYLSENGDVYAHSKYLLIDGQYDGVPQKVVFTGSNNYTTVGFHGHDEAMITIADANLEQQYVTNFDAVFNDGHTVRPTSAASVPEAVLEPDTADDTTGKSD